MNPRRDGIGVTKGRGMDVSQGEGGRGRSQGKGMGVSQARRDVRNRRKGDGCNQVEGYGRIPGRGREGA